MTRRLRQDTSWQEHAACRTTTPDLFFPRPGSGVAQRLQLARDYCAACPVAAQCLNYALATRATHGIWAGTTPEQRKHL